MHFSTQGIQICDLQLVAQAFGVVTSMTALAASFVIVQHHCHVGHCNTLGQLPCTSLTRAPNSKCTPQLRVLWLASTQLYLMT